MKMFGIVEVIQENENTNNMSPQKLRSKTIKVGNEKSEKRGIKYWDTGKYPASM